MERGEGTPTKGWRNKSTQRDKPQNTQKIKPKTPKGLSPNTTNQIKQ